MRPDSYSTCRVERPYFIIPRSLGERLDCALEG
jgi:hypothetical protein